MKRWLKWIGGAVALLILLALGLVLAANLLFDRKRDRVVQARRQGRDRGER